MPRRRHHYQRRTKQPAYEIDVTTFLNLMVVLVPFLLITAVFSRITIVELSLPTSAGGASASDEGPRVEVIVREKRRALRRTPALTFHEDQSGLGELGGLGELKQWLAERRRAFKAALDRG